MIHWQVNHDFSHPELPWHTPDSLATSLVLSHFLLASHTYSIQKQILKTGQALVFCAIKLVGTAFIFVLGELAVKILQSGNDQVELLGFHYEL